MGAHIYTFWLHLCGERCFKEYIQTNIGVHLCHASNTYHLYSLYHSLMEICLGWHESFFSCCVLEWIEILQTKQWFVFLYKIYYACILALKSWYYRLSLSFLRIETIEKPYQSGNSIYFMKSIVIMIMADSVFNNNIIFKERNKIALGCFVTGFISSEYVQKLTSFY